MNNNFNKISRFGVESFIKCPRCFYLKYKYKIEPKYIPFTLNIAVDKLFKNEFDHYRKKQQPHPIFIEHNLDAVPFQHEEIDNWRENFIGIKYYFEELNFSFSGAVDDVWVRPNGELIIADYKATSKQDFDIKERAQEPYFASYVRQLEMYKWLFSMNGFKVSDKGYIVYVNGKANEKMFKNSLKFDHYLAEIDLDDSWVKDITIEAMETLRANKMPKYHKNCETCCYLVAREENYHKIYA